MIKRFLAILILLFFVLTSPVFADQVLTLKTGYNFYSLTLSPTISPSELKQQSPSLEEIYLYSASSGSFLNTSDGTLSSLAAGKGYIFKASAPISINIPGNPITTLGDIILKNDFNLIGFSKMPESITFSALMTKNTIIKGIYKWTPASGTFIQVLRNTSNIIELIDNVDPQLKVGESYFINSYGDTKINYDGSNIMFSPSDRPTSNVVSSPVFNPDAGTYLSTQSITITSATSDAIIKYTIDGTTPSANNGSIYSSPITISTTTTIKAIAIKSGIYSDLVNATYVIKTITTPVISPSGGTFMTNSKIITLTCSTPDTSIYYTTDGTTPDTSKTLYTAPININTSTLLKVIAFKQGVQSQSVQAMFTILTPPSSDTLSVELGNGVIIEMVKIPAGSFQMGQIDISQPFLAYPIHAVTISKYFYMCKYEITQAQWMKIYGVWPNDAPNSTYGVGDNYPAYSISWNDICKVNGFLDKINNLKPGGYFGFRLPTEAEWEYSCRAGTQTNNYWGSDPTYSMVNNYAWTAFSKSRSTNPVGQKIPNAFGLYDMIGNVQEWCSDWVGTYANSSEMDPSGPSTGQYRVLRGGSYANTDEKFNPTIIYSASRFGEGPDFYGNFGFRLVLSFD